MLAEAAEVDSGAVPAFNGLPAPKGGCDAAGITDVTAGISPSLIPAHNNGNPATIPGVMKLINHVVMLSDSRVKAVNAKWSACMASRGHHYSRPQFAVNNALWNRRNAEGGYLHPVTAAEIGTASADVACRSAVNLYAVYWAVTAAYQRDWATWRSRRSTTSWPGLAARC